MVFGTLLKQRATTCKSLAAALGFALLFSVAFAPTADAGFKFVAPDGATGATSAAPSSPVVEGFADRVPLPVALRQILPRGTIYNIAPDVDMGVQVTWKGGRPWQQVLNDSLSAVGLQANITSSTVNVTRAAYMNGNVSGTSEPIQLMPPVRLTPPLTPVTIEDRPRMTPPATVSMAAPSMMPNNSAAPLRTVGEVTSENPDAQIDAAPVTPVSRDAAVQVFEVTSNDADIRAEARGTKMGTPPGFLTLPQGAEGAADTGAVSDGMVFDNGAAGSTLAPLDGSAPMVIGEMQPAGPTTWDAKAGQTLREVVTTWADRAGVEVNWQSEYDYPVQASLSYAGTFEEAVRTMLYGFKDATPQPIGRLHVNNQMGQQALLITTRGNVYEE